MTQDIRDALARLRQLLNTVSLATDSEDAVLLSKAVESFDLESVTLETLSDQDFRWMLIVYANLRIDSFEYESATRCLQTLEQKCGELLDELQQFEVALAGAVVSYSKQDYTQAHEQLCRAECLLSPEEYRQEWLRYWHARSIVSFYQLDSEDLDKSTQKCVELIDSSTPLKIQLKLYYNRSLACSQRGRYNEALSYVKMQQQVAFQSGVIKEIANADYHFASLLSSLDDYQQSAELLQGVLKMCDENGLHSLGAHVRQRLGIVYLDLNKLDEATEELNKAMATFEQDEEYENVASCRGNRIIVHQKKGNYVLALDECLRLLQYAREKGIKYTEANSNLVLGEIFVEADNPNHDVAKGIEYLLQAIRLFEEFQNIPKLAHLHKLLSQAYYEREEISIAYDHLSKHLELKEQIKQDESRIIGERYKHEAEVARKAAVAEARAGEQTRLLHAVLPASIADRLMKGERIADYFPHISILFADLVGFTSIASRMPAKAVLALLNYVFAEFDRIVRAHDCEKIKTMGDGYLAVAGAPEVCADHAERLARVAQEMMRNTVLPEDIRKYIPHDMLLHLRIGLHCGAAFAGIIGEERFVYDVYSDAVNLASRMQSTGEPGRIHCSADFAHHLQNRDESFSFEERGEVEVKGKGLMRTYYLLSNT